MFWHVVELCGLLNNTPIQMGSNNDEQIQVIGAGFGRTGTNSLKVALDLLGYNTYHMKENFKHGHFKFWIKLSDELHREKASEHDTSMGISTQFDEVFKYDREQYTATCDWPSALYWEEQLKQYPHAKVILTVRDPEAWYQSCMNTIFRTMPLSPYCDPIMGMLASSGVLGKDFVAFFQANVARDTFHGIWSKEHVIEVYQRHINEVKQRCPKEKLLVYEVSQGWAPLCEFLDKPIPDVPFPHVNDTKEFQRMILAVRMVAMVGLTTAITIPICVGLWYLGKN
jgi:hypothetical protein